MLHSILLLSYISIKYCIINKLNDELILQFTQKNGSNNTHTGVFLHKEGFSSNKKFYKMNIVSFNRYDKMVINQVEKTKTKNLRSRSYH